MKTLLLLFSFVTTSLSDCSYNCECADPRLIGPPDTPIFHTKGSGCFSNLTIVARYVGASGTLDNSGGIIYPDQPAGLKTAVMVSPLHPNPIATNAFEELGLVCENGKWMITKFRYGIQDQNSNCQKFPCMSASESNGKGYKAELFQIEFA